MSNSLHSPMPGACFGVCEPDASPVSRQIETQPRRKLQKNGRQMVGINLAVPAYAGF